MFDTLVATTQLIKAGRLRALHLPDVKERLDNAAERRMWAHAFGNTSVTTHAISSISRSSTPGTAIDDTASTAVGLRIRQYWPSTGSR